MSDYQLIKALKKNREDRLKAFAEFTGRNKKQEPIIELEIAFAELENQITDSEISWRYI